MSGRRKSTNILTKEPAAGLSFSRQLKLIEEDASKHATGLVERETRGSLGKKIKAPKRYLQDQFVYGEEATRSRKSSKKN